MRRRYAGVEVKRTESDLSAKAASRRRPARENLSILENIESEFVDILRFMDNAPNRQRLG